MATVELAKKIIEDSYSSDRANPAYAHAESIGYSDGDEFFSIAMAYILYTAEEVNDGARYPVEPGSLDDWFE